MAAEPVVHMSPREMAVAAASARSAARTDLEGLIWSLGDDRRDRRPAPHQREGRREVLREQTADPIVADRQLERILVGNELNDISYLARGVVRARSVCRVVIRESGRVVGYGTGFLVAPGVVMTNHHVLPDVNVVASSVVQFGYETGLDGNELPPVEYPLAAAPEPIVHEPLDFTLAAVNPVSTSGVPLDSFGWLRLDPRPGKAFVGEYLTIIQHPNGERKQVCVRENKLLRYDPKGPYVWYQTDTVGGSSGSPVFNNSWEVVALHHSCVPKTGTVRGKTVWLDRQGQPWKPSMGDDQVAWLANEGVRISSIIEHLRADHANHPFVMAITQAGDPPMVLCPPSGLTANGSAVGSGEGPIRLSIPIEIVARPASAPPAPQSPTPIVSVASMSTAATDPGAGAPSLIERVEVDQSNYPERNGYDPTFLDGHRVPLPRVTGTRAKDVVRWSGTRVELRYWNYSVVMSRQRRLAFFSAANVDPGKWKGNRDAEGDTWFYDKRLDESAQIGGAFYKKQTTFEKRERNPFDQGHLTRRKDLQWGTTERIAKRNGDDSYHYTNCSPQHFAFNQQQGTGLWFRLEATAAELNGGRPFTVINGPVFDAPLGKRSADGTRRFNPGGRAKPDLVFGDSGVAIPRQFFKVIAYVRSGGLRCTAFVVSQEELLAPLTQMRSEDEHVTLSDAQVHLYRVAVADLSQVTSIEFGPLLRADVSTDEATIALENDEPIPDNFDLELAFNR